MRGNTSNITKSYVAAYERFKCWAHLHDEIHPFPVDTDAATLHLLSLRQSGASVASVNQLHYGLNWLHKTAGYDNPSVDIVYITILEGIRRENKQASPQKLPVTPKIISKIRKAIIRSNNIILLPDYRLLLFILLYYWSYVGIFLSYSAEHKGSI